MSMAQQAPITLAAFLEWEQQQPVKHRQEDVLLGQRVHGGQRLVEQDQQRLAHQAPGDLQPPLLAAGAAGGGVRPDGRQVEPLQGRFGPLPALVNVPKSHVEGFEISAVWTPIEGLRIAPSVSYSHSRVDKCSEEDPGTTAVPGCHGGHYYNYDPFSQNVDLTGQQFPSAPEWQAQLDVQYDWDIGNDMTAFIGGNVNFQDSTPGFFFKDAPYPAQNNQPSDILKIDSYTLLDLRAGIENDHWRLQVWGRNVTDEYYFVTNAHVNDVIVKYNGMPATYGFTLAYTY